MKPVKVTDLKKIDPTRYTEGDVFYSPTQIGMIHNGKVETMVKQSDLKEYVKKKELGKYIDQHMEKVKNS